MATQRTSATAALMEAADFPLGRAYISALGVRRVRPFPAGARALVAVGDGVRPEQPLADVPGVGPGVPAGVAGRVVALDAAGATVEATAGLIHGMLGVGGPVAGPLAFLPQGESIAVVAIPRGAIIVYPHPLPLTLIQRATAGGAVGMIAPSASARDLESFTRLDLTALLDGLTRDPLPGFALMLTEGTRPAPMDATLAGALLRRAGDWALLNGRTRTRGNVRPEVLLPLPPQTPPAPLPAPLTLGPGARVRVTAGAGVGAEGMVIHVSVHGMPNAAGLVLSSAAVQLDDGSVRVVALHHLDRIG